MKQNSDREKLKLVIKKMIEEDIEFSDGIFDDIDTETKPEPKHIINWKIVTPVIIDAYDVDEDDYIQQTSSTKLVPAQKGKFSKFLKDALAKAQSSTILIKELDKAFPNLGADITIEDVDGVVSLVIKTNPQDRITFDNLRSSLDNYIEKLGNLMMNISSQQNGYNFTDGDKSYSPRLNANTQYDNLRDTVKYGDVYSHSLITESFKQVKRKVSKRKTTNNDFMRVR
jgi:hypothetical protein